MSKFCCGAHSLDVDRRVWTCQTSYNVRRTRVALSDWTSRSHSKLLAPKIRWMMMDFGWHVCHRKTQFSSFWRFRLTFKVEIATTIANDFEWMDSRSFRFVNFMKFWIFFVVESALLLAIRLDHWFHKNLNYDARSFFLAATLDILKFTKSSWKSFWKLDSDLLYLNISNFSVYIQRLRPCRQRIHEILINNPDEMKCWLSSRDDFHLSGVWEWRFGCCCCCNSWCLSAVTNCEHFCEIFSQHPPKHWTSDIRQTRSICRPKTCVFVQCVVCDWPGNHRQNTAA